MRLPGVDKTKEVRLVLHRSLKTVASFWQVWLYTKSDRTSDSLWTSCSHFAWAPIRSEELVDG